MVFIVLYITFFSEKINLLVTTVCFLKTYGC